MNTTQVSKCFTALLLVQEENNPKLRTVTIFIPCLKNPQNNKTTESVRDVGLPDRDQSFFVQEDELFKSVWS